ncbi:MAG: hypothetical protein RUMPE_01061 [Eubacteriales bacterium SKADARSKE-1]|nr:hypothetical protein [Eubacteriales bacterium SKADARSKE-1]
MFNNMSLIWLGIIIVLSLVELVTAQLVSIWFVIAGIITLIVSLFCESVLIQVIIFAVVTLILLALMKPILKKVMNFKKEDTNLGRNIGKRALVTAEINNDIGTGQVNVSGIIWTARSVDGAIIPKGTSVIVERIEGVKLIVRNISG